MNASPKEIAQQLLNAMTEKNKEKSLGLFADDATFFDPHYPSPQMSGKSAIGEGMDFVFSMLKKPHWNVVRTWQTNNSVVMEVETQHELMNGMQVTPRQVFVVDIEDGKICNWQSFVPYPPPQPST